QRREGEHGIVRTRRRVDALVLVRAEDERLPPLAEPLRRLRGEAPLLGELLLLLRVAAERARDETALSVLEPNRRTPGADDAGRARDDALQDLVLALRRRELAAELEQRRCALRFSPRLLVETRVFGRDP